MSLLFLLVGMASAKPFLKCEPDISGTELHVGFTIADWDGPTMAPHLDVMATHPIIPCLRAGGREYIVTEGGFGTDYDDEAYFGMYAKTHAAIGGQVWFPLGIGLSTYVLAGVKTVFNSQTSPDGRYSAVNWYPSVYSYTMLRWVPTKRFGLHLDFSIPLNDVERETGWYTNRLVGLGFDFHLGKMKKKKGKGEKKKKSSL